MQEIREKHPKCGWGTWGSAHNAEANASVSIILLLALATGLLMSGFTWATVFLPNEKILEKCQHLIVVFMLNHSQNKGTFHLQSGIMNTVQINQSASFEKDEFWWYRIRESKWLFFYHIFLYFQNVFFSREKKTPV